MILSRGVFNFFEYFFIFFIQDEGEVHRRIYEYDFCLALKDFDGRPFGNKCALVKWELPAVMTVSKQ